MEMEDHHNHNHSHHHPQQYGMPDLRQLMNGGPRSTPTHLPTAIPPQPTAELFQPHRNLTPTHHPHYDMMMFGRHVADLMPRALHDFASDSPTAAAPPTNITVATPATTASASTPSLSGLETETPGCLGGDASTGRWPRQETLTLLEIRSRLDPKFKEANQKGPLWDEVSRYDFFLLSNSSILTS